MEKQQDHQEGPMHEPRAAPPPAEPFEPVAGMDELARDLVALRTVVPDSGIGAAILRRFDISGAPGLHAAELGRRFTPRTMRASPLQMTVSPYAPPQRQISVARQGAPMWRPPAASPPTVPDEALEAPVAQSAPQSRRVAASDPSELPADLKALLAMHRARGNI